MRVPLPLAWLLLATTLFTAALLRRFHEGTAELSFLPPAFGSLLFAAVIVLAVVGVVERRVGRVAGEGVRLGSLTPLMLMLLVEKWVSIGVYPVVFEGIRPSRLTEAEQDAVYRLLAGAGLLAVSAAVGRLSLPAARATWRRARPRRWVPGLSASLAASGGAYGLLLALSLIFGGDLTLDWPELSRPLAWIVASQLLVAAAEETYYRGVLLAESLRLGPRLGLKRPTSRRSAALVITSALFALEHVTLAPGAARQALFTFSLGLLFGLLVLATDNLAFAAGLHAWVNGLLLGVAPRLADASGQPALPPGTYIGLALILAFLLAFAFGRGSRANDPSSGAPSPRPEARERCGRA